MVVIKTIKLFKRKNATHIEHCFLIGINLTDIFLSSLSVSSYDPPPACAY
jgi:hypothetical protein